ncbi:MAG: 3-hydroxyacyl-CoA dehydrogenase [Actinobacteria bacterium]|nr:3-hydroxyacyl-CoA dehydrogenase [Actinomycetota bacterium]
MTTTTWPGPVAIVGAGAMGRGIAYVAAVADAEVRLADVSQDQLDQARRTIERDLEAGVDRGKVTTEHAAAVPDRVTTTTDIATACEGASLVIEAVVERIDVKHEVFRVAESTAADHAVIATNTSALSITEIVAALEDPSRGVGMHFFNPVPKMKLCELIRGLQTSTDTMDAAEASAQRMGKQTVRVEDVPGFATSRLNALIGNEGFRMLEEGVARPEDIDRAARLGLNHPMGPLEMADLVGLDVRLAVLEHLADTLGERFRPTTVHRNLVAAGRLGRKVGRGVYRYADDGSRLDEPSDLR